MWIEFLELGNKKKQVIAGFYRVWNHKNDKSEKCQIERINLFADQIDRAAADKSTRLLIMGDANLDANKRDSVLFSGHSVSIKLKAALDRNGLSYNTVVSTYASSNGDLVEEGSSTISLCTYQNDSSRLWNKAPLSIKLCNTWYTNKKEIRKFVLSLHLFNSYD